MAELAEQPIINKLATYARGIAGIKNAYGFAQNPDKLSSGMLPAVIFLPESFESEPKGHHNLWRNNFTVRAVLFVAERMAKSGRLKYLENEAMPYGLRFRQKFQNEAVVNDLLGLGGVTAWLTSGQYGAGGPFLTYGETPYIGWVFTFTFKEFN